MNRFKATQYLFVVSSVFLMLVCNGAYGKFHEAWENASVVSNALSDSTEASLIDADEGTWLADSAIGSSGETAFEPNTHNVEIMEILGDKALRIISNHSTSDYGDSVWVHLADFSKTSDLRLNRNFKISLTQDTFIYFEEIGELDMPDILSKGTSHDKISLILQDLNGNELVYVLQRDPTAEPIIESAYGEIFLDPTAGFYQRNLFEDFSTLANFDPKAAKISSIVFEINEHGWAIIDDIMIGRSREMPDPPQSEAHFQGLGLLPDSLRCTVSAVSADGRVVIGHDEDSGVPFYWNENTGMTPLPMGVTEDLTAVRVNALSADGSMIVGTCPSTVFDDASTREQDAFYWTQTEGIRSLGYPSGVEGIWASAQGVSADGSYVAGVLRTTDEYFHAFGWTNSDGMVDLGLLPSGYIHSGATALSYDGHVVAGWSGSAAMVADKLNSASTLEAFRWTANEGMLGLGFLPGGDSSEASANSMDGTVIVGAGTSEVTRDHDTCYEAFRWSQLHGMHGLGILSGYVDSRARAVSGDGRIVVGRSSTEGFVFSRDAATDDSRAFIWDTQHGLQDLKVVLGQGYHADVSGWRLLDAVGISADGSMIVGNGINPEGHMEPWMAVIPSHYQVLDLAIVNPRLPECVIAGDGQKITLPVSVTNLSDIQIERDQTIDLIIKARPANGGPDVRLMVLSDQVIGVLRPGRSKRISVALYVPAGIASNNYLFVAQVGMAEASTPIDQPVTIDYGHVALVGQITKNTLPASIIAGETARGTVTVQITNQGNVAVDTGKTVDMTLWLQSQNSNNTFELGKAENVSISRLQPNKSKTANIRIDDTAFIPEDTYKLKVTIESEDYLVGPIPDGDQISVDAPLPGSSALPDLTIVSVDLPSQVQSGSFLNLTTVVKNLGSGPSFDTWLEFYLSLNAQFNEDDYFLDMAYVPPIAAGATTSVSERLAIPGIAVNNKKLYLIVVVDPFDDQEEGGRGNKNNVLAKRATFTSPGN